MLVGKAFGPYVIEKELGSGAMGTVIRGKHKNSGDLVAIKLMSLALGSSEVALARFEREVKILKQLDHPNIVQYKGSGRYRGSPFYVMEYVEGESLDHILHRRSRLSWEEVVDLGICLCAALQHAHDKGIIHRDLKPSNLMILQGGIVKLTDFGIAKDIDVTALTAANSTVGTAAYMAPEQCRGVRDITPKADLYSMGIMFYELLTGRKPFTGETAMEVFLQHANKTDYKRPAQLTMDVPIWLDTLVCQLMEKEPEKRPYSADKVAESLRMIREKVEAQESAGLETASKRRIDRTAKDAKLDDEDKDAARSMLGKKKKKKKEPAFYTKGWFTITALGAMTVGLLLFLYLAVFKTESAESLYIRAEAMMKSENEETRKEARDGPVADFLRYYPKDDRFEQVQGWANQLDVEILDRQMRNRLKLKFKEEGKEEKLFRLALDAENLGNTRDAAKSWKELQDKKSSADPEMRKWGLLGEKYAQELQQVEILYQEITRKIAEENQLKKTMVSSDPLEQIALEAVREEQKANRLLAINQWERLKQKTELPRRWYLLAAKRSSELKEEMPTTKKPSG